MNVFDDGTVTGRVDKAELQRGQGLAAWRQIADALEGDIAAGRSTPDRRLPTEANLAARYGVNRHTVRRALSDLATRGLVRSVRGVGTFVEARPLAYRIGPRTRFSENVARAGREALGELTAWIEEPASSVIAGLLDIAADTLVVRLSTRHRADGAVISCSRSWFPLPRFAGMVGRYGETGSITQALAACGVSDYVRRTTRVSARPAIADEARLLELASGRVVLQTDSINVDRDGRPIQATRALFAADRVEFVIED